MLTTTIVSTIFGQYLSNHSSLIRAYHRHRIDKYLDTLLANQPISDGEVTDRCKSLRRTMADCPS